MNKKNFLTLLMLFATPSQANEDSLNQDVASVEEYLKNFKAETIKGFTGLAESNKKRKIEAINLSKKIDMLKENVGTMRENLSNEMKNILDEALKNLKIEQAQSEKNKEEKLTAIEKKIESVEQKIKKIEEEKSKKLNKPPMLITKEENKIIVNSDIDEEEERIQPASSKSGKTAISQQLNSFIEDQQKPQAMSITTSTKPSVGKPLEMISEAKDSGFGDQEEKLSFKSFAENEQNQQKKLPDFVLVRGDGSTAPNRALMNDYIDAGFDVDFFVDQYNSGKFDKKSFSNAMKQTSLESEFERQKALTKQEPSGKNKNKSVSRKRK